MNKKLALILVAMAFLASGCNTNSNSSNPYKTSTVRIAKHEVLAQIADSIATQNKGLSGRDTLRQNDGMLFVFPTAGTRTFWMKSMLIPLDFLWINEGKVIQITSNVPIEPNVADEALIRYTPTAAVDSVLEVNALWADRNGIKVGDRVSIDEN